MHNWAIGLLLLALQTPTSAASDSRIDTFTLVLVVFFIAAMLALSLLVRRRDSDDPVESPPGRHQPEPPARSALPDTPPVRQVRPVPSSHASVPVWLQGVAIPAPVVSLSDITRVIEELLTARRNHDLAAGLALYAPNQSDALRERLGIDGANLTEIAFEGDPPALRSAEIVEATGMRVKVRATYSHGASETYSLTWLDGAWRIEEITAAR